MQLTFDSSAAFNGLYEALQRTADILIREYEAEIQFGMDTPEGRESVSVGLSQDDREHLHREVTGGAWAIIDSFGYGSKMDTNNPFLADYKSSSLWNPKRYGSNQIVGRPKGEYENIFGETAESSGRNAGKNLEGIVYQPKAPSKAFQNALIWFKAGGRIENRIQECIQHFDFSKYFGYK